MDFPTTKNKNVKEFSFLCKINMNENHNFQLEPREWARITRKSHWNWKIRYENVTEIKIGKQHRVMPFASLNGVEFNIWKTGPLYWGQVNSQCTASNKTCTKLDSPLLKIGVPISTARSFARPNRSPNFSPLSIHLLCALHISCTRTLWNQCE